MSDGVATPAGARARGPRGLARDENGGADPTFAGWDESLPLVEEYAGTLLEAEADAAYRWAAHAATDRDVLDVACGPGHGSGVLLDAEARSVVGVDGDVRAVEAATRLYGARARFLRADPLALPFAPQSFDLVTCFGVLERSEEPDAVLDSLRRIVTDDGLLLVSFPRVELSGRAEADAGASRADDWRGRLASRFYHVRLYRRRLCLAAAVVSAERTGAIPVDETSWVTGGPSEDRAMLAAAGDGPVPDLPAVASLMDFRDLHAYRDTLAAWEERARRAEADGSAKHWELVAAREAQRRLRKRLHDLEHRPLRVLSRVLRGRPARLGQGPPIRPSERGTEEWD